MAKLPGVGLTLSGGGARGVGTILGFTSALDLFLLSHDVTDLEYYSGVSAGSIIASVLAAGISPLEYVRAGAGRRRPGDLSTIRSRDILAPNFRELGGTIFRAASAAVRRARSLVRGAAGADRGTVLGLLPSAPFRNDRIAEVLRSDLESVDGNDFRKLGCRLVVTFHDVLRNERIACGCGPDEVSSIPIHEAVTASAAIPGVFTPRRIRADGRTYLAVDGGTTGLTINIRGAEGLDVVIAYNDADYAELENVEHASAFALLGLTLRLVLNHRNVDELAIFMDTHPSCHVLLFQPPPGLPTSLISHAAALRASRVSFEATRRRLAEEIDYFRLVLEPRGVKLNEGIAEASYDEVLESGRLAKEALKRRHGL